MDDAEIIAFFVKHLGEADNPDDLILEVCSSTGRAWADIEALLRNAREEYRREITMRQLPLLVPLALGLFVCGLLLTAYAVYSIITSFQSDIRTMLNIPDLNSALIRSFHSGVSPILGFFRDIFIIIHAVLINPLFVLCLGVAMISGSLFGMRDVWKNIMKW